MQHTIPVDKIGPHGEAMADAVRSCVHCGFCLPACPTYGLLGEEMDSPRGRIFLMKEVLEEGVEVDDAVRFMDRCLGCLACVTACPSGVEYGQLITSFRARSESQRTRRWSDRLLRRFVLETLPYPARFRMAVRLGWLGKIVRPILPGRLRDMLSLLPDRLKRAKALPAVWPAEGKRRARVALLAGCAQRVLAPEINWATLRVLAKNGVETVIPREQACCGALAAHTGALWQAKKFARRNLKAFPQDVDAVLTNAAGCGSGMHEYALWLRGESEEREAEEFVKKIQDVTRFLSALGFREPPSLETPVRVAYHDACHLAHAQGVRSEPRQLLSSVGNLQLLEVPGGDVCCGSAGTYNLEQPDLADRLGQQKAKSILELHADVIATGNIGCITQIETHLRRQGATTPVMHTIEVLDRAFHGWPTS